MYIPCSQSMPEEPPTPHPSVLWLHFPVWWEKSAHFCECSQAHSCRFQSHFPSTGTQFPSPPRPSYCTFGHYFIYLSKFLVVRCVNYNAITHPDGFKYKKREWEVQPQRSFHTWKLPCWCHVSKDEAIGKACREKAPSGNSLGVFGLHKRGASDLFSSVNFPFHPAQFYWITFCNS